jgi:hypothetical protein
LPPFEEIACSNRLISTILRAVASRSWTGLAHLSKSAKAIKQLADKGMAPDN